MASNKKTKKNAVVFGGSGFLGNYVVTELKGKGWIVRIADIEKPPDGLFITVYDKNMVAHECLGKWFKFKTWRKTIENEFANEVIQKASQSRLTSGQLRNQTMTNYTITYLYVSKSQQFKRGWHGVRNNAFYLPEVFLENTYENGKWINKLDTEWQTYDTFNFDETNEKLASKSNVEITKQPVFYDTAVIHKKILNNTF